MMSAIFSEFSVELPHHLYMTLSINDITPSVLPNLLLGNLGVLI